MDAGTLDGSFAGTNHAPSSHSRTFVLDMVHHNPGEARFETKWTDPRFLKSQGFSGAIPREFVQCAITYFSFDPSIAPPGSSIGLWIEHQAARVERAVADAMRAGLPLYPLIDVLVVPVALLDKYGDQMKSDGRIDIARPKTQEVLRAQIAEIFNRFPDLAGLTVRFGETYLHDTPFHAGERPMPFEGEPAIAGHVALLNVLREEVCVRRHKKLFYRTWDFGQFHDRPDFYLAVTNEVEPHPNLFFSIKFQEGDFHRLSIFNPTIAIGRHCQIIEVQCQAEAYGKGAHPYYIGKGAIEGWEEYAFTMKPGQASGLRDIILHPLCSGVWTWSRGGGWDGPCVSDELWCDVNTYVVSQFARHPEKTEAALLEAFCTQVLGLQGADVARFRSLCLLSAAAVFRGQLSFHGSVPVWWCRDQYLEVPDLSNLFRAGKTQEALEEKSEAVKLWRQIEHLAREIKFKDPVSQEFAEVSTTYGRIKYAIFEQIWTLVFLKGDYEGSGKCEFAKLGRSLAEYDRLWSEWRTLQRTHAACPSLYMDIASPYSGAPAVKTLIEDCRGLIQAQPSIANH